MPPGLGTAKGDVSARVRQDRWNMPSMPDDRQGPSEPKRAGGGPEEQGGVFGNLPGTRPSVRSPRRGREQSGAPDDEGAAERPAPARRRQPDARPSSPGGGPEPPQRPAATAPGEAPDSSGEGGGVEDLAWAGIAVAAEAATLGVRLLSRAMGAVRKPPDRR
jgi:hypothetical protein